MPALVIGALQLVELLLSKVPVEYKAAFRREGVFHEVESLASRTLTSSKSKEKEKDKDPSENTSPADVGAPAYIPAAASLAFVSGYKKLSSLPIDPDDAITIRARVIKFKFLNGDEEDPSADLSATLSRLVNQLANEEAQEKDLLPALVEFASLFASPHSSVSSFELLQSGVIDGLLQFISESERTGMSGVVDFLACALILSSASCSASGDVF
jgi:E3 ubiquitin-protein ligase TRIP12